MYTQTAKYFLKGKTTEQDINEGGKRSKKVKQGEEGVYFVYKDRLMYMGNENAEIREICKMQGNISGILVKPESVKFSFVQMPDLL